MTLDHVNLPSLLSSQLKFTPRSQCSPSFYRKRLYPLNGSFIPSPSPISCFYRSKSGQFKPLGIFSRFTSRVHLVIYLDSTLRIFTSDPTFIFELSKSYNTVSILLHLNPVPKLSLMDAFLPFHPVFSWILRIISRHLQVVISTHFLTIELYPLTLSYR